jgi:hypothetical protein
MRLFQTSSTEASSDVQVPPTRLMASNAIISARGQQLSILHSNACSETVGSARSTGTGTHPV